MAGFTVCSDVQRTGLTVLSLVLRLGLLTDDSKDGVCTNEGSSEAVQIAHELLSGQEATRRSLNTAVLFGLLSTHSGRKFRLETP